ncbi:hypothetical protein [Halorussus sp. MSC15.2]|uniref:DUF7537 family lipoprotein n=1 Tax=Halorussus sp. MSC15.2 TaxID=2283638 RepID=UPI0013D2E65B|nr:hypothetical protein [Halorussus sp. MSC15.2]NEU55366.1 hypothetical protein [Halorussus sp. MSC15.2]
MRRRVLQLLVLSCLVALAGCSGALPGDGAGEQTLGDVSYPAGVSDDGTNVTALANAHESALENSSLTLSIDSTVNSSAGNRSVVLDAAVGSARDNVLVNGSASGRQMSVYLTPEKRYTRIATGDNSEAAYQVTNRSQEAMRLVPSYSGSGYLDQFAGMANFTPTGVRTVNGTTLLVLQADGSNATATDRANVSEFDATILVDERGVVHSVTVEATSSRNGQEFRTTYSMTISDVGETTVAEPAWLDEARNQTGN